MAKALRTIAVIAGAVALVATGIGAIGGATFAATALGGTISTIATWAGVVAGVAGIGAQLLTKPPPARGSVTETIIEIDPPSPYVMGEGYFAGVMRHRVGYGPTLKKVPNPYLFEALALCVAGPIEGPMVPQVDFGPIGGYYSGWLATDVRVGNRPDSALGAPMYPNPPGWGPDHKLSGVACVSWGHKFDKDGEVYANGLPTRGVVAKWVKVYDPRKDSTRPGGSGSHRLGIETTYEWSENPALQAGTYAYGRYVNGKRVIGVGLPEEGIDWEGVAAWANDCDANGWRMFGVVFEGAEDDARRRWQNLRDICIAGGGEPLFSGAVLGFHWQRPRVPLDTVTEADLAEGPQEVTAMQSWRDRLNTLRPRYTSPLHNWSVVQAEEVQVASYLAEDGELRAEDIPFNFVKDKDQAAQLAAYWLTNSRELTPITLTLMPRLRAYRPGECLRLELPELGLDHDAVIIRREFDPGSMTVTLTLVTETSGKHAFALGRTGVAPPTPALTNSAADRDVIARAARAALWSEVDGPGRPEDGANRVAPANANRVPFSLFERADRWQVRDNESNLVVTGPSVSVVNQRRQLNGLVSFTAPGQIFSYASGRFPVAPGERLSVSALVEAFGTAEGTWSLTLFLWNTPTTGVAFVIANGSGPTGFNDGTRAGFIDIPSGYREGELRIYAQSSQLGLLNFGLAEPMVTSALAGQTEHPRFTPGRNAFDAADVTAVNTAAFIAGQAPAATDPTIQPGATRTAPGNANRVRFSRFEAGGFWAVRDNASALGIVGFLAATVDGRRELVASVPYSAAGQLVSYGHVTPFPVVPGERLSVSARVQSVGAAAASWSLALVFYDAAGAGSVTVVTGGSDQRTIATGTIAGFVDVPANARNAELRVYSQAITSGVLSFGLAEPMVVSAVAGQTLHPAYVPGINAWDGADVTVQQPVVSLLNPATGRSTSRRINSQIVATGVLQTINVNPITASTSGTSSTITINAHQVFDDAGTLSFSSASIGGLAPSTLYYVYDFNPDFVGGARSYTATTNRNDLTGFGRRYVGVVTTPASGSPPAGGSGGGGGGWGGGGGSGANIP